jgi:membrane peptidoglycan carboxypeptidase
MSSSIRPFASDLAKIRNSTSAQDRCLLLDEEFVKLVLVAEDKRFFSHLGVDFTALARALFGFLRGRPKGGASTIEMQLVRTVTNQRQRTLMRKVREMLLAFRLCRIASKNEILAAYLRQAYFGELIEGVEAAARALFKRPLQECCSARKAILAAALVYPIPNRRTPRWYRQLFRRARWIRARAEKVTPHRMRHPA